MDNSAGKTQHDFNLAARKAEQSALRRYQATEWLQGLVGPLGISNQPSEKEFISCLRSGLVLCNAINKIQPGSVQKVVENHSPSESPASDSQPLPAFQYFENVKNFLVAAEELKLTTFEAPVLERDNLESGSSAKVVDCILELKALHDWKQMNGGYGFNKPPRSPFVMLTAGKINSKVSEETSLDPHRRLSMTSSCYKKAPAESETQNLEELIVATLAQCMVDKKENIEANLLASIRSRNPAAIKILCKNMLSCLKEQGQRKMQPEVKPTLGDLLREECDVHLRTTKVMESSSIIGTNKRYGACLEKGYCNHEKLLMMQENELSILKSLLSRTKEEFEDLQSQLQTDMKILESQVQEMSTAALGYQKVVKENENLHKKVQVLKGGLEKTLKIVDFSPEEAELQKELESLKMALSKKELQSSEMSVLMEIKSPSGKSKSVTEAKLLHSASTVITPPHRRLGIENRSTQKLEKSSSVRNLSVENRSTQKVEKSSSVRRLSTGTSSMVKLGKAQEPKGPNYVFEKAEAISKRIPHHSRRLSSDSGQQAQTAYLEDQMVLKTPSVQNRIGRLSLEGQRYVSKNSVISERSGLPQAAMSASKPKVFTSKGDFRPEVSRHMAPRSPLYPGSGSHMVRLEKERKVPSFLEPPATPEALYTRSQLMIESLESQTASMKATVNGKTSQIKKSLRAIGKLINGSEKRNTGKQMETTFDATNGMHMKLPVSRDARMLRRQSLAQTWPPVTSRTPSFGVISSGNRLSLARTPSPVRASDKSPRRWL
ncbi:Calponin-homology (CH) domain-containing protein [Heracleum sosnowskyi]|uniref:Calponin-homology (CH) domain-containing protein n=1 Tax=Heracleum sosnowskyi TaxID=360622 RepID=A0AAD8J602_9APIA|nr:Calponin-homology (CH) domain-containing protein [Heracleum sosnowskyi]